MKSNVKGGNWKQNQLKKALKTKQIIKKNKDPNWYKYELMGHI